MEAEGGHENCIIRRNTIKFGIDRFVLTRILWLDSIQGLMIESEGDGRNIMIKSTTHRIRNH